MMNVILNRFVWGFMGIISLNVYAERMIYGLDSAKKLHGKARQSTYVQLASFINKANAERFFHKERARLGDKVVLRKLGRYYSVGIRPAKSYAKIQEPIKTRALVARPITNERKKNVVEEAKSDVLPLVTVSAGAGRYDLNQSFQSYAGIEDVFTYEDNSGHSNVGLVSVFLGAERSLQWPGIFMQGGFEYNYFANGTVSGLNTVGVEQDTSTIYQYRYKLQSQQMLAVAKLYSTWNTIYHPNVSAGLGASFNRAYDYGVRTNETGSVNIAPEFADHTQSSFSYSLGLGLDADINPQMRFGLGYRFSDLGKSSLGGGTLGFDFEREPAGFTLGGRTHYINQMVAQLSYIPR